MNRATVMKSTLKSRHVLQQWESQLSAPVPPHNAPFPAGHLHRASAPDPAFRAKPDPYDLYEKSRAIYESRRAEYLDMEVHLRRQKSGFGFRVLGGDEAGQPILIGAIIEKSPADLDGRLRPGDELLFVDGIPVVGKPHRYVIDLMHGAARHGQVNLVIRRRGQGAGESCPENGRSPGSVSTQHSSPRSDFTYANSTGPTQAPAAAAASDRTSAANTQPSDVIINRKESEGFGFVIISSLNRPEAAAINKISNPPSAPSSEKQSPMAQQHSPNTQPAAAAAGAASQPNPAATESNAPPLGQPGAMSHQSPVAQLPTAPPQTYTHESSYRSEVKARQDVKPDIRQPPFTDYRQPPVDYRHPPVADYRQPPTLDYRHPPLLDYRQLAADTRQFTLPDYRMPPVQIPPPRIAPLLTSDLCCPPLSQDFDFFTVELEKSVKGFGFSIRGGREYKMDLFVLRLAEDGPAIRNGRMRVRLPPTHTHTHTHTHTLLFLEIRLISIFLFFVIKYFIVFFEICTFKGKDVHIVRMQRYSL
ncbi:Membrane-associated guanylate kinase, WW and PDZ domain-containing protein 2 [Liparis tanakae]|uniref:Membrane-associated guanylate kinase, WW and PDZ domain-containing protein 2 n=1 Tax=Liparis tanakae TaxID=230148 RepID=A0A4Z2FXC0_9TELE|nr:Membrane-associated guanylate kinase, WW and PDZ domain-containing protein 2 [Liparis tanakae]